MNETGSARATAEQAANGSTTPTRPLPTPKPASASAISEKGVEFISAFEGLRDRPYNDAAQPENCTVGYGHLLHHGPCSSEELARRYTQQECLTFLRQDCAVAEAGVRSLSVHLTQPQFDALTSFAYNCGTQALNDSIRSDLHAGHYGRVPGDLGQWIYAGNVVLAGLIARRKAEGELFAHGTYSPGPTPPPENDEQR